jgi:hypothetical protein
MLIAAIRTREKSHIPICWHSGQAAFRVEGVFPAEQGKGSKNQVCPVVCPDRNGLQRSKSNDRPSTVSLYTFEDWAEVITHQQYRLYLVSTSPQLQQRAKYGCSSAHFASSASLAFLCQVLESSVAAAKAKRLPKKSRKMPST